MTLKLILYTVFLVLSIFIFSAINFDGILRKGKVVEAKLMVLAFSFALSYLLTQFVLDFIN